MSDKVDLVCSQLIALLESGRQPWRMPWASQPMSNFVTGHIYSGQNPLLLTIALWSKERSTERPWFCSFNQAKQKGWAPKKGSKACWIRYSSTVDTQPEDSDEQSRIRRFMRWYAVFHVDDLEGDGLAEAIALKESQARPGTARRAEDLDAFFERLPVQVDWTENSAFYQPSRDRIGMPPVEAFHTLEGLYGTLAHEHAHSTGHPSRLARFTHTGPGSKTEYAFEELVAEITAAYLMGEFGYVAELEFSAGYLQSWLQLLRSDSNAFFRAESLARKALAWLLKAGGEDSAVAGEDRQLAGVA